MVSGKIKLQCVVYMAVSLFSCPLFSKEFSWEEVEAQAKAVNPALRNAEESLKLARQNYYRSYTNFLPQFAATAGTTQSESDISAFSRDFSMGLSGSLSLFSGFGDLSEVKIKKYEYKIAELNFRRACSDIKYDLRVSFINLLWAQESLRLSQEILERRRENYDMIRLKYEAGIADKGSLLRVEADRLQTEYELNKAKRALDSASLKLIKTIGKEDFDFVTVTGDLSQAGLIKTPDLREALNGIPEYLVAEYTAQKSAISVASAKSSLYPEISLSANTSMSGAQWMPETGRWSAGINVSYAFFPGGRNIYDIRIAKINRSIYEDSFIETRQQLSVKLDAAIVNYVDSAENISVREKYLNASTEQSNITTAKYINGLTTYQDWYTIENDYISSRKSLLNAKRDALLAEAQLKNVLGE